MNPVTAVYFFILGCVLLIALFIPPWRYWWRMLRRKRSPLIDRATSRVPVDTGTVSKMWQSSTAEPVVIYKKVPLIGLYRRRVLGHKVKVRKYVPYLLTQEGEHGS